ncbi:hypothetical protein [Clostridium celatum]|nr:hypothetical protein [Clostridium celatum]
MGYHKDGCHDKHEKKYDDGCYDLENICDDLDSICDNLDDMWETLEKDCDDFYKEY